MYNSSTTGFNDQCFPNNNMKAESGLTCSLPPVVSRKRMRDNTSEIMMNNNMLNGSFLGEDISLQMQQQQLEIDHYIANHTEKVRLEIEERRKRNSRRIIAAVEEGISKRLRAKEEEIIKIAKLNWALEEKVKSLCVENQIWRELAQTNEATANTLRNNLKQLKMHSRVAKVIITTTKKMKSAVVVDYLIQTGCVKNVARMKRVCFCCHVDICVFAMAVVGVNIIDLALGFSYMIMLFNKTIMIENDQLLHMKIKS
ncbi:zinc ion binding protein [Artemisia annua]|uniref:Zinc ion binding protein n=1 Tax=Artemisia annua TaxID=35608 RepID=A0A2U1QBT6_ARTAN|nr:zinc ion binding protein [Artemisia annua]